MNYRYKTDEYLKEISIFYRTDRRPYREFQNPMGSMDFLSKSILSSSQTGIVITGPPGSGKTTFLDEVMVKAATSDKWIPVFASLRNFTSTLDDLLLVSIQKFIPDMTLEELFQDKAILILLDGLDEVPTLFMEDVVSGIEKLKKSWKKVSIVITSRPYIIPMNWLEEWEVHPMIILSKQEIYTYLKYDEVGLSTWQSLEDNPELMNLAQYPAFLHTIKIATYRDIDVRKYLMEEIPLYSAWRGYTKSPTKYGIEPSNIDEILGILALKTITTDQWDFTTIFLEKVIKNFFVDTNKSIYYSSYQPYFKDIIQSTLESILATDVLIKKDDLLYRFAHKYFLDSYVARYLVKLYRQEPISVEIPLNEVLNTTEASLVAQYFLSVLNEEEFSSLAFNISRTLYNKLRHFGKEVILSREKAKLGEWKIGPQLLVNALELAFKFRRNQIEGRRDILVLAVHGFNTRGDWKNKLGFILSEATDGERYLYRAWDYGSFRLGILFPWSREKQIKKFQDFYNELMEKTSTRPEICIVAHSFGTYIVGHAIRKFPEIYFDRVLFLGSALPRSFFEDYSLEKVQKLLNVIGQSDTALRLARFIPGLGDAGRRGFIKAPVWLHQEVEAYSDHSDGFGTEYMKKFWLPFFRSGVTINDLKSIYSRQKKKVPET